MVRSPSAKKNNLSLMIAPPTAPPYWLRWKGPGAPGGSRVLTGALTVREEEQLVFDDRSAESAAILAAREGTRCPRKLRRERAITEHTESLAVVGVGSGLGGDVNRTGGSQLRGHVQAGLADLELLDCAGRDVGSRRADRLVGNINTIDFDASRPAETATERD